jgi:hypothetical protein
MAIATPLWHPGQHAIAVLFVGLIAGLAMALTVAAVSGLAVVRLASRVCGFPAGSPRTWADARRDDHDEDGPCTL